MSIFFFFFKQKTAYEMRISDWSSDVCSSDLAGGNHMAYGFQRRTFKSARNAVIAARVARHFGADFEYLIAEAMAITQQQHGFGFQFEIGRASCRERVCQ